MNVSPSNPSWDVSPRVFTSVVGVHLKIRRGPRHDDERKSTFHCTGEAALRANLDSADICALRNRGDEKNVYFCLADLPNPTVSLEAAPAADVTTATIMSSSSSGMTLKFNASKSNPGPTSAIGAAPAPLQRLWQHYLSTFLLHLF